MSKRQDIMAATLDLIHEEGLQAVTFSKIFKRANVGSGTIYNYFENKEEIVNALYREARLLMGEYLLKDYNPEASLYERFKCLQLNRLQFGIQCPKEYLFIDAFSFSPYISPELRSMDDAHQSREVVISLIVEGQKQGIFREMDSHLCHQLIHGIISSILKGYYVQKYPLNELQMQQILEASWKTILV
ncbi:TetR/AcrR family transcriptional regulator [Paenibacillus sacheonensis]|uniref:TetR family transcriptional regulator n=1 Tax=Paenibacillus sacheonensis TaxID=742054 RepID=A0A7X5C0M4_9BACL|nr:TetR/AcrR family transcriptional regulator [Paenibacillus sacheonensis]MBM7564872.1 AcrR family transcriptional regulator [Paenibacillus sacheonensis]NBC69420.1 TetR family transcriptional regulator [Paenibacillus sacheonensis]